MKEDVQEWRRKRFGDLATTLGGNAVLGRKLGYRDGAFVGQMLKGLRPITEKTVLAVEAIRDPALGPAGARGWFDRAQVEKDVPKESVFEALTAEEMELLTDIRILPDEELQEFVQAIAKRAASARAFLEKHGVKTGDPVNAHARRRSASAVVQITDRLRQQSLPLDGEGE